MTALLRALSLAALLALAGCGPGYELAPVQGTVRAGGVPLDNVVVTFLPDGDSERALPRSFAHSDAAGKYHLQTAGQEAGAVIGTHRVTIEDLAILNAPRSPDGTVLRRPPIRFSPDYADPLKSTLSAQVKAGPQTLNIDVPAKP